MKKVLVVLFVLFALMFFPVLSALEIEMKDNFSQGETLLMKISGNFYEPISEEDISFYRNHVQTSIIPEIVEIDDDFYIYGQLYGKNPGNYSLIIEDVKYYKATEIIEEDLMRNFTITSETSDFYIQPGAVFSEDDFSIEIQNLQDKTIFVDYELIKESEQESSEGFFESLFGSGSDDEDEVLSNSFSVKSGEKKKVNFYSKDFNAKEIQILEIKTNGTNYRLPIYVNSNGSEDSQLSYGEIIFSFEPEIVSVSMATNSSAEGIIYLKNLGNSTIENISLDISGQLEDFISLSDYEIDEIDVNDSERIYIYFSSGEFPKNLSGQISANSEDKYTYLSVYLKMLQDYIPTDSEGNPINLTYSFSETCSQLSGTICSASQECSGETEAAIDGICCLAVCEEIEESSTGKTIGWTIIILILLLIVWFYFKKYKGV